MASTIRIVNATLYTPERATARSITLSGKRIVALGETAGTPPADVTYDAEGGIVTPGLIDALVHGGAGVDTMDGSLDSLRKIAEAHGRFGTTAFCCGISAAPMERLVEVVRTIGEATRNPFDSGARILGVYVEGKFGAEPKHGAHPAHLLELPTRTAFETLWKASGGTIRVFSYAPEKDAGLELTRYLAAHRDEFGGIVPTMGHTNATYDEACRAIDAGIRRATHTFNGMTDLHHRRLGAAEAVLSDPRVHAELIADGHHVHPTWARLLMKLKTASGTGLITDAGFASALTPEETAELFQPDPESGVPVWRERRVVYLRDGALYLHPTEDKLTGSVITQHIALKNAIAWGATIEEAVRMAATSPAENLGLDTKGALRVGNDADLVVFDSEWNPRAVFVEGEAIRNELPTANGA